MDSGEIIESMEDEAWSHSPSLTHENEGEKEERDFFVKAMMDKLIEQNMEKSR